MSEIIFGFMIAAAFALLWLLESRVRKDAQKNCDESIAQCEEMIEINKRMEKSCKEAIALCDEWQRMFNELRESITKT